MSDKLLKEMDAEITKLEATIKNDEESIATNKAQLEALKSARATLTGGPMGTTHSGRGRGRPKGSKNKTHSPAEESVSTVKVPGITPTKIREVRSRAHAPRVTSVG